jgi:hypothetical protein
VVGRELERVWYRTLGHAGFAAPSSDTVDDVEMDVMLAFDGGVFAMVSWGTPGWIVGLDLQIEHDLAMPETDADVEVTHEPRWEHRVGKRISEVAAAWGEPGRGEFDSLWSLRFSFEDGESIAIVLGELTGGGVRHAADNLVVLFGELESRACSWPWTRGNAFGELISGHGL